mmetsp:Transcript_108316/g.312063  ORF Transcript_108316/g.312063 Transcript_108316/m.312063 type:complete len:339 (-) Transcript_108316:409-1425(-)
MVGQASDDGHVPSADERGPPLDRLGVGRSVAEVPLAEDAGQDLHRPPSPVAGAALAEKGPRRRHGCQGRPHPGLAESPASHRRRQHRPAALRGPHGPGLGREGRRLHLRGDHGLLRRRRQNHRGLLPAGEGRIVVQAPRRAGDRLVAAEAPGEDGLPRRGRPGASDEHRRRGGHPVRRRPQVARGTGGLPAEAMVRGLGRREGRHKVQGEARQGPLQGGHRRARLGEAVGAGGRRPDCRRIGKVDGTENSFVVVGRPGVQGRVGRHRPDARGGLRVQAPQVVADVPPGARPHLWARGRRAEAAPLGRRGTLQDVRDGVPAGAPLDPGARRRNCGRQAT